MASGSLSTNAYDGRYYRVDWSSTTNIQTNQSTVNWWLYAVGQHGAWYAERTLIVTIAGRQVVNKSERVQRYDGLITYGSLTVSHDNSSGKANIGISIQVAVYTSSINCTADKTFALDTIPRGASIDEFTSNVTRLDTTTLLTVKYTPKVSDFYYKLRLSIPGVKVIHYVELGKKGTSQQTHVDNMSYGELSDILQNNLKSSTNTKIGVVIETYSDSAYNTKIVDSSENTVTLTIPSQVHKDDGTTVSLIPKFDSHKVPTKVKGDNEPSGIVPLIMGMSKLDCSFTSSGVLGATIVEQKITNNANIENVFTNNAILGSFNVEGEYTIKYQITDSRGKTNEMIFPINIHRYFQPIINFGAYRSDENGNFDEENGENIFCGGNFTIDDIDGNIIKNAYFQWLGNYYYFEKESGVFKTSSQQVIGNGLVQLKMAYNVFMVVEDSFGTYRVENKITVAQAIFNALHTDEGENHLGLCTYARNDHRLTIGTYDVVDADGNNYFIKAMMDLFLPIGSQICNSNKNFDPNTLYVGTKWKRIKGVVLGGINEADVDTNVNTSFNQESGTVIGSKYMQSHNHKTTTELGSNGLVLNWDNKANPSGYYWGAEAQGGSYKSSGAWALNQLNTGYRGLGNAENIQPTSLTYIWERTE